MALQVWLPLNGSVANQGLSGAAISGSPASWGNGLMGKCATFTGGQVIKSENTHDFDYTGDFSWACWVNTNYKISTGTGYYTEYAFSVGRVDSTTFGYGLQVGSTSKCLVWYGSALYVISVTGGKWTHIAFVKSETNISVYVNGSREINVTFSGTAPTFANSIGLGVGCFHYNGGDIYKYNGSISDFRLYDNALSPKEVHEIAQGLCCHYPLNDPFCTSSINKYSGDTFEGKPSSCAYTMVKLPNERGYNFTLSYTGTGSNTWRSIQYPVFSFTAGKTYDYSCKIRVKSGNFGLYFRTARMSNDWDTQVANVMNADGKWHEYHFRRTLQAKSTRSGTEYDTKPLLEFYSANLVTKDTKYSCDFDIKDVQVSECETDASVSNLAWNDGTIYDTSGFSNHGTVPALYRPALGGDSPRYDKCYELEYKHYITGTMPFGGQAVSEFTVSVWLNQIEGGGYSTWLTSSGYGSSGLWLAVNTEGSGQWGYRSVSPNYVRGTKGVSKNTWYLFTYVFKNGIATWYLNGVKDGSTTYSTTTMTLASTFILGDNYGGSSWNTNFHGKLSDFRLYATALSDADILALYNSPVSVTSSGALITKGEVIENL